MIVSSALKKKFHMDLLEIAEAYLELGFKRNREVLVKPKEGGH